jgi:PKD repeat protein
MINNLGPTAVINASDKVIESGESIAFSAARSNDPDDDLGILNFTWFLNEDNIYSNNFTHVFALSGVYKVSLEVTDPDGAVDSTYVDVVVKNKPPVLNLSVTPTKGTVETEFIINAEVNDPDGYLTGIYIDLGAEKVINQSISDAPSDHLFNYKYNFKSNKNKTITAYAWDNFGTRSEVRIVEITLENLLPLVDLGGDRENVLVNRKITFTPQVGDKDGEIIKYEWDFDGDGIFDVETTEASTKYQYISPGTYSMVLRVTDNDNGVAEDMINITVIGNGIDDEDDTKETDGYSMDLGLIIAIIIIVVIVLILGGYFILVRRRKPAQDKGPTEHLIDEPEEPAAVEGTMTYEDEAAEAEE